MNLPKYIDGPVSLRVHYLQIGDLNKLIFIFGDEHTVPKYQCGNKKHITVIDFLKTTFKSSLQCIDFFLETPFIEKTVPPFKLNSNEDIVLQELRSTFQDCLMPSSKRKCLKFGNVRMHYIDLRAPIRNLDDFEFEQSSLFVLMHNYFLNSNLRTILIQIWKKEGKGKTVMGETEDESLFIWYKKLINILSSDEFYDHIRNVCYYLLNLSKDEPKRLPKQARDFLHYQKTKIIKQWEQISNEVQEIIKPYIEVGIEHYIQTLREMFNLPLYLGAMAGGSLVEGEGPILTPLLYSPLPTDYYLLYRMLKSGIRDSKIVFIYAGGYHAEFYGYLLKNISKTIGEITNNDTKCLKIPPEVHNQVFKITKTLSREKCSYPVHDELELIAKHYKKNIEAIKRALKHTSLRTEVPEYIIREIIWKSI